MKTFVKITPNHIQYFTTILGEENVFFDEENLNEFGHDETEDLVFPPEVALTPRNTEQVSDVMKYCFSNNIPVTPIGSQTGLSGGALSVYGGAGLSMKKMNAIVELDEKNLQIIVEPGLITEELQNAAIEKGLFYAPDPSSKGSCSIGGNLAENAGGPRAVKYGVTKDWVLNLEVVLPNGEIIWTGANTLKNSTGYNLTQLMVGSEGTLGIITKAVLKLIPFVPNNISLLAPFNSATKACEAVSAIFRAGITPSALEFMERDALDWIMKFDDSVNIKIDDETQAHLLIEIDGTNIDLIYQEAEKVAEVLERFDCGEILLADNEAQKDEIWRMRRRIGEAVKSNSIYKEEDTVVPRYELPTLLSGVKSIGDKYGFKSVCYGHAGDGNLHINIIKGDLTEDQWNNELPKAIRELFEFTVSLGGTLSGEHGIGYVQKDYMDIAFNKVELDILKSIKNVFDPTGIMNPGKLFA
ncbi:FAD-binding protein [Flavobacteriales bacterium]|nr:FAD-binding protein [Flavobacteriales bacterium]